MVEEKKIFIMLLFVIAGVLILSFTPGFTGYSIYEGEEGTSIVLSSVLAGSTVRSELKLENNADTLSYGKILATGEAAAWIQFVSEEYAFLPGLPTEIPVYISIPEGTAEGEYHAKIALLAVENDKEQNILEDQIISYIPVTIIVNQEKLENDFRIDGFTVYDAEQRGNIFFQVEISHLGNSPIQEDMTLSLYDNAGKLLFEQSFHPNFFAYEKKEFVSSFSTHLEEGKYYAKLHIDEESKSTDFRVVEDTSLKRKGELLYLETKVRDDHLVDVEAYFQNSGEGVEYVSLQGTVGHDDELVEEFQTDAQTVLPGDYTVFRYSYSDALQGAYLLDAEIASGNIVLAEKSVEFYSSDAISLESNVVVIISLVMLLLIVSHFMLSRRKNG